MAKPKGSNLSASQSAAAQARAAAKSQIKAKERRTTVIIVAAVVALVVLFVGIVQFIVSNSGDKALGDEGLATPVGSTLTGGIPISQEGVAGQVGPADATKVDVYLDFMCSYCLMFEQVNGDVLDTLREEGIINYEVHPIAILDRATDTKFSTRSANAAATIAQYSPEHLSEFMIAVFSNQPKSSASAPDDLSDSDLGAIAKIVGVSDEVAAKIADGEFTEWVKAATDQSSKDGVTGTPTIKINGETLSHDAVPYLTAGVLDEYLRGLAAE